MLMIDLGRAFGETGAIAGERLVLDGVQMHESMASG
jgi:hypothetical protein